MEEPNTTSLNVMIAEDSGITGKKLKKMLEELGHNVVGVARTGEEAVEQYEKLNPDIVTMDIIMPGMNGVDAAREICSKFKDACIIMITSHGQKQMVINAVKAGARGFVIKPFKHEILKSAIDQIVKKFL
ncbi:MAG: response regulator [Thermodesulfobacteriota bacterium]|nr:response regulator [Thermodesulfobacteriota bacterium]